MGVWHAGSRVRAGKLGIATVVRSTERGALVELDRPAGMRIECPSANLELVGPGASVAEPLNR